MNNVLYDWLTFTTKIHSLNEIMALLGLEDVHFENMRGRYCYQDRIHFDGINIMYNGRADMGICVEMSGQGCRTFETHGYGNYQAIFDLVDEYWASDSEERMMNISRLDVAYDSFDGILDLDYFVDTSRDFEYVSRLTRRRIYIDSDDGKHNYYSVCHGSEHQSNVFIRIYDKLNEQRSKKRTIDDSVKQWVRCEMQLRNECALGFIRLKGDIRKNYFDVLNNYLRYIIPSDNVTNKSMLPSSPEWLRFIESWETASVFVKPGTDYNLGRLSAFINTQLNGALTTYINIVGVDSFLNGLVECSKARSPFRSLNPKYQRLLDQYEANTNSILDYLAERNEL